MMSFEIGIVLERSISLFSVEGKIYAEILVDRVHRVTGGLMMSKGILERGGLCRSDLHTKADR